jgi:hypothetical protein
MKKMRMEIAAEAIRTGTCARCKGRIARRTFGKKDWLNVSEKGWCGICQHTVDTKDPD